jgi:hypothetical protein
MAAAIKIRIGALPLCGHDKLAPTEWERQLALRTRKDPGVWSGAFFSFAGLRRIAGNQSPQQLKLRRNVLRFFATT